MTNHRLVLMHLFLIMTNGTHSKTLQRPINKRNNTAIWVSEFLGNIFVHIVDYINFPEINNNEFFYCK